MRLLIVIGMLASVVCGSAMAQNCETMVIRNAAGQVISNSVMCADETGAWVDPVTPNLSGGPAYLPQELSAQTYELAPIMPMPLAKPLPQAQIVTVQPLPLYVPQPQPLLRAPTIIDQPAAVYSTPVPTSQGWQPTSGAGKRKELYAKLGLVCSARKAVFCGAENVCTGLCEGSQGWCDGKTGEIHASLESIERANCRKKKRN